MQHTQLIEAEDSGDEFQQNSKEGPDHIVAQLSTPYLGGKREQGCGVAESHWLPQVPVVVSFLCQKSSKL